MTKESLEQYSINDLRVLLESYMNREKGYTKEIEDLRSTINILQQKEKNQIAETEYFKDLSEARNKVITKVIADCKDKDERIANLKAILAESQSQLKFEQEKKNVDLYKQKYEKISNPWSTYKGLEEPKLKEPNSDFLHAWFSETAMEGDGYVIYPGLDGNLKICTTVHPSITPQRYSDSKYLGKVNKQCLKLLDSTQFRLISK